MQEAESRERDNREEKLKAAKEKVTAGAQNS
jgi:hypothetical protein